MQRKTVRKMAGISVLSLILIVTGIFACQAQLLYKVEGGDLKEPSYVLGTHHLVPLSVIDSIAGLEEALESSSAVVGEIDMTGDPMLLAAAMRQYMTAPADSTLRDVMTEEEYAAASQKFISLTGLPLETFDAMKPMVAATVASALIITKELDDHRPEEQLDTYFQKLGASEGKSIIALETAAEQAEILYCTRSVTAQAEMLKELLDDSEKTVATARMLNTAYLNRDITTLYRIGLEDDTDPELTERLLTQRNRAWAGKLPEIMRRQGSFIAVGALHLPGERGLLRLLMDEGYEVTPVDNLQTTDD